MNHSSSQPAAAEHLVRRFDRTEHSDLVEATAGRRGPWNNSGLQNTLRALEHGKW